MGCGNLRFTGQSEAQVTSWTCDWHLRWWRRGQSCELKPLTSGIWYCLWVESVRIELNCRTPSWWWRIAWWCGEKTHTLEMGTELYCALLSIYTICHWKIFKCLLLEKTSVYTSIWLCLLSFCVHFPLNISPLVLKLSVLYYTRLFKKVRLGLPWWRSGWESACQCRGHGFEPWSGKIPHAAEQLGPWAATTEPARLEPVLRNKRGCDSERPAHRDEEWPPLTATTGGPRTETKTQHS